jgi:hypothetical protein
MLYPRARHTTTEEDIMARNATTIPKFYTGFVRVMIAGWLLAGIGGAVVSGDGDGVALLIGALMLSAGTAIALIHGVAQAVFMGIDRAADRAAGRH